MDLPLYYIARALIAVLQALPLAWVARLGRLGGAAAYWLDGRHRRVAVENLRQCLGDEKPEGELRYLARENFRRIGENFACAAKTASMNADEIKRHLTCEWVDGARPLDRESDLRGCVVAVGHFGNFELYARVNYFTPGFQFATTYRGLRQPGLNRLLQSLREKSGCVYFERRRDADALREAMSKQRMMLGLLVDQHAGDRGLPARFFGRECSTSAAPAVYALRYEVPLHTAICYRAGLGRWRIEFGPEIPTRVNGEPRPAVEVAEDINRAFETAIRRDPANWFWVHRRWKPVRQRNRPGPKPPAGTPS